MPVTGYGGLERQGAWLAAELNRLGHDVTIYGNTDAGPTPYGWTGVPIASQHDILKHVADLRKFDIVHDRTKDHPLRMTTGIRWVATLVWSDQPVPHDHAVYVSDAIRQHFGNPTGTVIPECVPTDELPEPQPPAHDYLTFGRIDRIKGIELALRVVAAAGQDGKPYTVAGHVGRWTSEPYYPTVIRRLCAQQGHAFIANPDNFYSRLLIANAKGLIHTHRWLESFSEVVAEALCHGVPVLTTDTGAPQEWVRATGGGIVVPLAELEAGRVPEAAVHGFFRTDDYWTSRRQGIRERARAMFDVKVIAKSYLERYRRAA